MLRKTASALALLLLIVSAADAGTLSVVGQSRWAEVASITDGDTFTTTTGERIRLLGINTPEIAHNKEPGQPLGNEAKKLLTQLIVGKMVKLKGDREKKDGYGRTLAQVYLRSGLWINEQLVRSGLAHVYTFAPNFRWAEQLLSAEREARKASRGIWKSEAFKVLDAAKISNKQVGEFRLIRGRVTASEKWRFQLEKITVTVPRNSRQWFQISHGVENDSEVLVRGTLRTSSDGGLFLALHSPYDLE